MTTSHFRPADVVLELRDRWYVRLGRSVRGRLALAGQNLREVFWSPSARAFGLAMLLAYLSLAFAAVDGAEHGLRETGWKWTLSFVLTVVAITAASVSGRREERERLIKHYKDDIEAARDVCEVASRFVGDPHRSNPVAEKTRLAGTRLRMLLDELQPRSFGTHGRGPS